MTTDEFARAAYPLLHEGIILLRAHAGEGPAIELYVAMVEKAREQYRAAKEAPAPAPDVYDGPVTAGMRFGYKDSVFVPDGRRGSKGEFLDADGSGISEPNLRGMYRPIPAPAPEPSAPPAVVPTCHPNCGGRECWEGCFGRHGEMHLCSDACADAGRPLNPPPSDPVTVATGGVPAGYRLGDRWTSPRPWHYLCRDGRELITKPDDAELAAYVGALVPVDTARPGPAHPATGTTCTRCGQVIQSVLPAFPPVATVDGWRHERCQVRPTHRRDDDVRDGEVMTDKSKPPIEFTVTWTQTVRVVIEKYTSASDAKRIAKNVADCLFDREDDVVAERREDVPMDVHSGGQGTVISYDECLSAKATKPETGGAR